MTPTDWMLLGSAALMGLGGTWHCALMCGSLCAGAACRSATVSLDTWAHQTGRLLGYSTAGALAGSAGAFLGSAARTAWLQPLWAMAHAAALAFGLWLLWQGRQPAWVLRALPQAQTLTFSRSRLRRGSWGLAGLAWVLLPCGLLQSALLLAALTSSPAAGAGVMATFAAASAPGLLAAPLLMATWRRRWPHWAGQEGRRVATRLAGVLLVAAAGWALARGVWGQVQALC